MRCYKCLRQFEWDDDNLHVYPETANDWVKLEIKDPLDPLLYEEQIRRAWIRCPSGHYLPSAYARSGTPLIITVVGRSVSGKTHLLAAIVWEIIRGGLEPFGLGSTPLEQETHQRFMDEKVGPLFQGKARLKRTLEKAPVSFVDGFMMTGPHGTRPVIFIDVSGEDLLRMDEQTLFVLAAGGFLFVVDTPHALGIEVPAEHDQTMMKLGKEGRVHEGMATGARVGDETFVNVVARLSGPALSHLDVPATVVLNKCDLVRYEHPVADWLNRPIEAGAINPKELRAESRDAYAFLYEHDAQAWLQPFDRSRRCTLHFASSTGMIARDDQYARGAQPMRVLGPLVALLAMAGMLDLKGADEVGV